MRDNKETKKEVSEEGTKLGGRVIKKGKGWECFMKF